MLKVGDRVFANIEITFQRNARNGRPPIPEGSVGTVVEVDHLNVSVEFDKKIIGHNCGGRCKDGHGWAFPKEYASLFVEGFESKIELMLKEVYCLK